ncbi:DUF885 domain-containing protein [Leifsonia poae]|uniref:DUF885 domain-containing protein n=1 Tax=Leifsonia poae TaxID=110933 RepID=UPI001CBE2C3F|nr:DUF885 domain-containing protein [Leifsonia poae]
MSAVRELADRYLAVLAQHEPAAAQALGRAASDRLGDFSADWAVEKRALQETTLAAVDATDPGSLEGVDRNLHAAFRERLASDIALFDTGFTPRLLAPLATPVHEIREAFDDLVVTADSRGDEAIARLARVPEALEQLRGRLEWARAEGGRGGFSGTGVAARRQVVEVADQIAAWIDPERVDYFPSIPGDGLDPRRRDALTAAADDATGAFAAFERYLRDELAPLAPERDAVGEQVYAETARSFLGTALDLDEVYAYGWSELERLVGRSRALAAEILGTAARHTPDDVAAAAVALDADDRYALRGTDETTRWLRDRLAATIEAVDGVAFDLPSSVWEVDCVVPTAASGVVYYTPGAPDGSSRSKIVWTLPTGAHSIGSWHEVTSFHHEGVPGHHLEHTINRANPRLHPWQRYLCEIHGYAEGWAHYSEELSDELGLIRDPAERFGMVLGQIWRAVRIVADIGLHTGRPLPENGFTAGQVWTTELARTLLVELARVDPVTARFEVDRYLGWPGQALAFKVGAKLWTEARAAAARRGTGLKEFHSRALSFGPMGLAPLNDLLLADDTELR